jgi:succinylarginine dihydrolase
VGHQNVFLYHEKAFVETSETIQKLKNTFEEKCGTELINIEIKETELSLAESVKTYLFNSQLVTLNEGNIALIAPEECRHSPQVQALLQRWLENPNIPIKQVIYQDIWQSMQNGGGPACLRLRFVLNQTELDAMHPHVLLTESLYNQLVQWIHKHYRDRLLPEDLADPHLLVEGREALDELTSLLQLGSIYPFQQMGPPEP